MKYSINAPHVPDAPGPFSMGTTAGRLIFTAGQVALDPRHPDRIVEGGVASQLERILDIVEELLGECDCSVVDVAKATLYLACLDDLPEAEAVISRRFPAPAPALSVVEVSRLPLGALVEMDCIACR
ncbi:RidA family protein [Olsenella massiliensis]|uniref:RidA family protein n=1 Tax=Olsenella massiliensis TaxID=1622075 RepID=UPI00071CE7E6|nr:Rid family hydrolase [Olsenella massiliensis]